MDWSWDFAIKILPNLLRGLGVTVEATILAYPMAVLLGLIFELTRRSGPVAGYVMRFLVEFIRGTPLLVQLYVIFYVLPDVGILLPPLTAGVVGLAIHYSAYTAEIFRAGIASVPRVQWEAARVCNLTRLQTWRYVVIPQAVRPVIPSFANYLIAMFKETPLLSAITVLDLMGEARGVANYYYRYVEPIVMVGAFFLIVSLGASAGVRQLELRLGLSTDHLTRVVR